MNEPLRRCGACRHVFDAAPGVPCPKCGAVAHEIARIHYLVPAEGPIPTGAGNRMLACLPARAALPKHATGERDQVTCPKCRASKIFAEDEADGTDNDAGDAVRAHLAAQLGKQIE